MLVLRQGESVKISHLKNKLLDNDCAVGMWMREDRGLVVGICKIILLLKLSKYTSFLLKQQIISQITNVLITHLRCLAVKLQLLRYIFTVRSMSNSSTQVGSNH